MSEESVDIHIRLSADGVRMLENLMVWAKYTSKSAYIEEMVMAIEDIFAAYYTFYKTSEKTKTAGEQHITWTMFSQYLVALLRRLGWVGYLNNMKKEASDAEVV